ncbi:hypothetical protein WKI65_31565 [Streptomyces sp. MS1.AVA.3]|uniref:hypothetical protein n=1 Tax=Streptomyces decoyicus TaxID=249567 RepID=UPI0030C430A4
MITGIGKRLALVSAAAAFAVGVAQVPASANAQRQISGTSYSGCAYASGDYSYSYTGMKGGRKTYDARWDLRVGRASCDSIAHLRVRFDYWDAGADRWRDSDWKTIASSASNNGSAQRESLVANVRFVACDYTSSSGNSGCMAVK